MFDPKLTAQGAESERQQGYYQTDIGLYAK